LQEPFRIRAPDFDLDAIFAVEGRDQSGNVVGRDGRVEGELLLPFGAFDQPLLAVGALVGRDLGHAARLGERARSEHEQRKRRQRWRYRMPTELRAAVGVVRKPWHNFARLVSAANAPKNAKMRGTG